MTDKKLRIELRPVKIHQSIRRIAEEKKTQILEARGRREFVVRANIIAEEETAR